MSQIETHTNYRRSGHQNLVQTELGLGWSLVAHVEPAKSAGHNGRLLDFELLVGGQANGHVGGADTDSNRTLSEILV
jgi:hypothetical protein